MSETDRWFVNPVSASEGNLVTPLIDGIAMMAEIDHQLAQLTAGDFCFFGAWMMNRYMNLALDPISLGMRFELAIENGADIRILLFKGMPSAVDYVGSDPTTHRTVHVELLNSIGEAGGQVVIDLKHPSVGSHHDKYAIFGKQTAPGHYTLTAFCGGIDLHWDRHDDSDHDEVLPQGTILSGWLGSSALSMKGWHDVHAKIEGPAAATIWSDFAQRWNDQSPDATDYKTSTTMINTSAYSFNPPTPTVLPHRVEVLNTYHCSNYDHATPGPGSSVNHEQIVYYSFVNADGIHTIHDAYLNAIGQAQHYIYIENLYFYDQAISEALRDRLNAVESLHIILVSAYMGGYAFTDSYYLNQNLAIVREAPGAAERFHACTLRHDDADRTPIFVHSKMMIVDDLYFTIGSANISPRSMTHDTEINIGVVGSDLIEYEVEDIPFSISQSARDFRVALWREHLQRPGVFDPDDEPDDDDDPLFQIPSAIDTWIQNIDAPSSRVCSNTPGFGIPSLLWSSVLHPSQQCY